MSKYRIIKIGFFYRTQVSKNIGSMGLVDEDPQTRQPTYISGLGNPIATNHDIKIFHDFTNNNTIVMLCPRLEEWLYNTATRNKIQHTDYGLQSNPGDLHKDEFRRVKIKFNDFLKALLNSSEFKFLKSYIKKLQF
jgi:hypothetical protein